MSKRTVLLLLVLFLCVAAVIVYFRQRNNSRYNTGEVVTIDTHSAPVPEPVAEVPHENRKEPAGHPLEQQEAVAAQPSSTPASQEASTAPTKTNPDADSPDTSSGRFQVYRQGDITWRVNTETGSTCVLFATDEQWRKPRVYRRACER